MKQKREDQKKPLGQAAGGIESESRTPDGAPAIQAAAARFDGDTLTPEERGMYEAYIGVLAKKYLGGKE